MINERAEGWGFGVSAMIQHYFNSVPWKGTISQRVRTPPGNCRSSR